MLGSLAAFRLIIDPECAPEPATALLRRLYGLTDTEAKVASVSFATVRTHLQHVFD
jgi:hypothetical protein